MVERERTADPRALYVAALGIVYGDIGTSPLYALRECFHGPQAVPVTRANVLGVLSLVLWALVVVISVKYLALVMRADNGGEGGILALMALINARRRSAGLPIRPVVVALGLFGAALLYGDSIVTPAISVLSAVEGVALTGHGLAGAVVPVTLAVLVGLFSFQRHGTARIGAVFGPVMVVWFAVLAALGLWHLAGDMSVLAAIDPRHGAVFLLNGGGAAFVTLGTVFLVVTGGEALYADMGHFGPPPIRKAWFRLVLPALLLNYFGQGALLLRDPSAVEGLFYRMAPASLLYPLIGLASVATVIASQAVISGAFSLTRQAIQLGYWPRVRILHTSSEEIGQIYVPAVNWALFILTTALVLGFRSSSGLAAAYGIAVTSTMVITTLLFYLAVREIWGWGLARALSVCAAFLLIDTAFLIANIPKIPHGGWVGLVVASIVFLVMATWRRGREILASRLQEMTIPLDRLGEACARLGARPVPGTAVFLTRNPDRVPPALLHNLEHNGVRHERIILLTVVTEDAPHVPRALCARVIDQGHGVIAVEVRHGFMQDVDIPQTLRDVSGLRFDPDAVTYFLGRETLLATSRPGMAIWRERLFAFLSRNALRATTFFHLPPDRVFEVGVQVEL